MDDRVSLGASTLFCVIFSTIFSTSVGGGGGGGGIAGTMASRTNHCSFLQIPKVVTTQKHNGKKNARKALPANPLDFFELQSGNSCFKGFAHGESG